MLNELKKFFEENTLAHQAAASIKNGREIEIIVVTSNKERLEYTFKKDSGKNKIEQTKSTNADLSFVMPEAAILDIVNSQFDSVGQVGLRIFEKMLSNDENHKITAKLNCGILSLLAGGYLGVLTAGGSDVAKFLATKGLGNMGKLKDAISKMKGNS